MEMKLLCKRFFKSIRNINDKKYMNRKFNFNVTYDQGSFLYNKNSAILLSKDFIDNVDKICANTFSIYSLKDFYLGNNINFHKDYKSNIIADFNVYSKNIKYKDIDNIGDIKYIWQLNRHLFILQLSLAYKSLGVNRYLEKMQGFLQDWFWQNSFLKGINWTDSLEVAIRTVNWALSWQLVASDIDTKIKNLWLENIYNHLWFLSRNINTFSSKKTNIIGEAAGLFIGALCFPKFRESSRWISESKRILENECLNCSYYDGVNSFHSSLYQRFNLDFLIISLLIGKRVNIKFSNSCWSRLEKMIEFLYSIRDFAGNYPCIGDDDDGNIIDLNFGKYNHYDSIINIGAYLFRRNEFLKLDIENDIKANFLSVIGDIEINSPIPTRGTRIVPEFPNSGYYILGCNIGEILEEKMIFYCNSSREVDITEHKHADSLSFTFSAGGCPIFIDPGTYTYFLTQKWRKYFKSTRAHNTMNVEGIDQVTIFENSMQMGTIESKVLKHEQLVNIRCSHNGYLRLEKPVSYVREIAFDRNNRVWNLIDETSSDGKNNIEFNLHLHPECTILEIIDYVIKIKFPKGICFFKFDDGLTLKRYFSDVNNMAGWYSPLFDVRMPAITLRFVKEINGSYTFLNNFRVEFKSNKLLKTGIKILK